MAKDFRENKRGCLIVAAIVALLLAALAWGIFSTGDDPRAHGIATPGAAPQAPLAAPDPGKTED